MTESDTPKATARMPQNRAGKQHCVLEKLLILAVQSNFHGKSSILFLGIKIAIAFPYHTVYIFQSISMVAANPKAARGTTVWTVSYTHLDVYKRQILYCVDFKALS